MALLFAIILGQMTALSAVMVLFFAIIYERNLFTAKNKLFKQDNFVDEVKHFYTDLINTLVKDDKEKLHVFDENGLYLATKKIGKNNPKAEQVQTDNEYRMRWNREC